MNINVNIERLILRGVPLTPQQRHALHGRVERELSRLLTSGGGDYSSISDHHVARVSAAPIQLTRQNNPQQLGSQIAAAIYGGIEP